MTPTLSEVESTALKAARGAGMSWGMAEEAAFAARWLAEQGLDGLTLLAHHLTRPTAPPTYHNHRWQAAGATLCPIATGAALSDHFHLPEGPLTHPVELRNLSAPALILPFLATSAARSGVVIMAQWHGCTAILAPDTPLAVTDLDHLLTDHAPVATITAAALLPNSPYQTTLTSTTEHILKTLVQRTYVPASDQSRRGAGGSGNDDS